MEEKRKGDLMKKVLIVSSSLRCGSNSELLAKAAMEGAADAGHNVTWLSLKDKEIHFCKGCLACQNTGNCVIRDDMDEMTEQVRDADVIVFATPVYYYGMSGQLKTFLDRCNPLYIADYQFREVYLITASAEDGDEVYQTTQAGIQGWVDCFPKAKLAGVLSGGGVNNPKEVTFHAELMEKARSLGNTIH